MNQSLIRSSSVPVLAEFATSLEDQELPRTPSSALVAPLENEKTDFRVRLVVSARSVDDNARAAGQARDPTRFRSRRRARLVRQHGLAAL